MQESDKSRTTWVKPRFTTDETIKPVAVQIKDKNSIYNHYKTFLNLRNTSKALTYGELEPVNLNNEKVSAFVRSLGNENLLVLHNLSNANISVTLSANEKDYQKVYFKNKDAKVNKQTVEIPAYSTLILKK